MARAMHADTAEAFRAVIEWTYPADWHYAPRAGSTLRGARGPYASARHAKAALTRELNAAKRYGERGVTVKGRVERAALVWEVVE